MKNIIEENIQRSNSNRLKKYNNIKNDNFIITLINKKTNEKINITKKDFISKYWGEWSLEFRCFNCHKIIVQTTYHNYIKKIINDDFLCVSCKAKQNNAVIYLDEIKSNNIKKKIINSNKEKNKIKRLNEYNNIKNDNKIIKLINKNEIKYIFKKNFLLKNWNGWGIEYICDICGKTIQEHSFYTYEKKVIENNFICKTCKISNSNIKNGLKSLLNNTKLNKLITPLFNFNTYNGIKTSYLWQCNKCNTKFKDNIMDGHIPRCPTCYPKNQPTSKLEKEVANYIKSLNINLIENDRKILGGKELDIYIPSHNLAIEFNGLYWHSELNGKDKNYHLNKTIECEKQGIQLLHIFEDEWINKQEIIKNIIKVKLGLIDKKIYGRKTVIKEIDNQENFLNINHIQGYIPAEINIGLYYKDELVSLLTFNKKYDWEILRYVDKLNIFIIGGFAKMLKYFKEKYRGNIIICLDRRLFSGEIYEDNDFTKLKPSKPNYYYSKNKRRYNRQQFIKYKLNHSLAESKEWSKIWDCGNNIFKLEKKCY